MRIALWILALLLALTSAGIIVFLLKPKPPAIAIPRLTASDVLNICLFIVAVAALYVAVATYVDAKNSGEKQQAILDASRKSLESVVATASGQQKLLQDNLDLLKKSYATATSQLTVTQSQWKREQERQARRANVKMIGLNDRTWEEVERKNGNVEFVVPAEGWVRFIFVHRNVGAVSLVHPIYLVTASVDKVFVDQEDFRGSQRTNHNQFQLGGPNVSDLLPFDQGGDYRLPVDVTIPSDVAAFDLRFRVVGENMDGPREFTLHVTAKR